MKLKVIKLKDHESRDDASAKLIKGGLGPGIYSTKHGYVVCLGNGLALEGHFDSLTKAEQSQALLLAGLDNI